MTRTVPLEGHARELSDCAEDITHAMRHLEDLYRQRRYLFRRLREEGMPFRTIGTIAGVSEAAVIQALNREDRP